MYNNNKVLWLGKPDLQVTWEPATSLPANKIKEFEDGITLDAIEDSTEQYGVEATVITTQERSSHSQPAKKDSDRPASYTQQ